MEIIGLFVPVLGVVFGLVAWAWRSMEKNIDRLELTVREHVAHDISVHDTIFDNIRIGVANHDLLKDDVGELKAKLAKLEGEHKVYHNE